MLSVSGSDHFFGGVHANDATAFFRKGASQCSRPATGIQPILIVDISTSEAFRKYPQSRSEGRPLIAPLPVASEPLMVGDGVSGLVFRHGLWAQFVQYKLLPMRGCFRKVGEGRLPALTGDQSNAIRQRPFVDPLAGDGLAINTVQFLRLMGKSESAQYRLARRKSEAQGKIG